MDWRYRTVYYYFSGIDFLFVRTFCSRIARFSFLIAFSAYFLALSLHLQSQKRQNSKNHAYFVILLKFPFSKNQENYIKMQLFRPMKVTNSLKYTKICNKTKQNGLSYMDWRYRPVYFNIGIRFSVFPHFLLTYRTVFVFDSVSRHKMSRYALFIGPKT